MRKELMELMYTDLRYRNPRCRMEAKHNTKPGEVKIFTRAEIECQSASKFDPLSAFKIDPPAGYGLIPVGAP